MSASAASPAGTSESNADRLAAWWPLVARTGFTVGSLLGLVDVTTAYLRDAKVPLGIGLVGAVVTGMIYALLASLTALATGPLVAAGWRRLAAAGGAAVLATAAFFNLMSLWVYWLTGVFPTLAPLQMFWASPSQFLHAGLRGQEWRLAVLLALSGGLGAGLYRFLGSARVRSTPLARSGLLSLATAGVVLAVTAANPSTTEMRNLQRATPELRWIATLAARGSQFEQRPHRHLAPAPGPPLAAGAAWLEAARQRSGPRPNVLLVMLESLPADHLGHAGYPRPISPHLDRLAGGGWRLSQARTVASQSNYAQTAILSSLLPIRHHQLETYVRLDYPRLLFHDLFADLGYQAAIISSQNEHWQGMSRFLLTGKPVHFFHSLLHPGPHLGRGAERKLPDHLTVDHLFEWLDRADPSRPWAVYLNLQRTHFPYELPPGSRGPYQPSEPSYAKFNFLDYPPEEVATVVNRYDNAVQYVDEQIGRVVERLAVRGQSERTLIVVVADHGEHLGEDGMVTHGKNLLDGVLRVPLLLSWPGRLEPRIVDEPVSTIDVLPTVLDLLELPPHPALQGSSFRDRDAYARARKAQFATNQSLSGLYAVICWPFKLVINWGTGEMQLFRLTRDPAGEDGPFEEAEAPEVFASLLSLVLSQRGAQLDYYQGPPAVRAERYAPRLLACPDLPLPRWAVESRRESR
ncbi:MAG TPA: sulfatase [Thermoanaerobaculia bacterium]|nr:sulfatase [Thermoanaerobaculia bacterium]